MKQQSGFSYLEALIGLAILVVVMGLAMVFLVNVGKTMQTESTTLATQQTGRLVLDELSRTSRQVGFGIARAEPYNSAVWQGSTVHASSHTLAFNADIDRNIGTLQSTVTVGFPVGSSYTGEGAAASQVGAETYVYTLDANDDGSLTAADRTEAATGNYNPAADTDNPLDFAVFRKIYGYNGTDNGGELEPLAANLFTNATSDSDFPDGSTPDSLFTYWLSEDLDGDGRLDKVECVNDVVDSCPPATTRDPLLYMWGDTNFDGRLSEAEKTALLATEVGSAGWAKNPLVESGSYVSTTVAVATDPSGADPYTVTVADADKIAPGTHVLIGSGGSAERHYVDVVLRTGPEYLVLASPIANVHGIGATVTAQPSTLLRAIRSVGITFSAITGKRDSDDGKQAVGRAGRVGTKGLDYRVVPFRREVEVINATSVALVRPAGPGVIDICPLVTVNACNTTDMERTKRFVNLPGQGDVVFRVTDEGGAPASGVTVSLSNADSALGALAADKLTTDASGYVTADYVMTGSLGTDYVEASTTCITDAGLIDTSSATAELSLYRIVTDLTQDCSSTVCTNEPDPAAPFTVTATSADGPVVGLEVDLSLGFDPLFLPVAPDFTDLVGDLEIGGSPFGTTDSSGVLAPQTFSTDASGQINGAAGLALDNSGKGARLQLTTAIAADACNTIPEDYVNNAMFFELSHDSVSPSSGCTTLFPCTISAGMSMPSVEATLKINDQPVPGAALDFTATDVQQPTDGVETGASVVKPDSGVTTDASGQGQVKISNNGALVITPATPLVTRVDVTSPGHPSWCSSGLIRSSSDPSEFVFEAPAPQCDADLEQSWLSKIDNKKICAHSRNANDPSGGCDQFVKGVQITVYLPDGVTPVPGLQINQIEGGAVSSSPVCSTTGKVTLFKDSCHLEDRRLNNGEMWYFTTFGACDPPMTPIGPEDFFTFSKIEFAANFPPGATMDITLIYLCNGVCDPTFIESETFTVNLPF